MKSLAPAQIRIYEAAVRFFAERGTTHASVTELAQAAGLARGTIYNNVANLDSLFEEVATALGDEMHGRILASFEFDGRSGAPPRVWHPILCPSRPRGAALGPLYCSLRLHDVDDAVDAVWPSGARSRRRSGEGPL